jgi:hypothetical protein
MEDMWEYLCNNSPQLICKPRSKTPGTILKNSSIPNLQNIPNRSKNSKLNKIVTKLGSENSLPHVPVKPKLPQSLLTLRVYNNASSIPSTNSKKHLSPLNPHKKFSPVLSTIKPPKKPLKSIKTKQ